ncbi:hypothetical protein [Maridesulfovibrio sp.]|uniref:hypothetical protein n=1 Tax=Maridesulfovibrio sp. TaxID=2795000 RepID=UPI002A18DDDC|nr:hypothetical protein [Maridesulfovibrio sp.]
MSDIIDFALSTITDYIGFENLATEVMQEEGFHDIKPLGGVGDYGQDATVERLYAHKREKYVFQYTVDKNTYTKLIGTIDKLLNNNIDFHTIIYVTSTTISSSAQTDLISKIRKKYHKTLVIYERKTFKSVLANSTNTIFVRHFPDIETQIAAFSANIDDLSLDDKNQIEAELLKVNLAFIHNDDAQNVRKHVFDNLTFSVINEAYPHYIAHQTVVEKLDAIIPGKDYIKNKLSATLTRLQKQAKIELKENSSKVADKQHQEIELNTNDCLEKLDALVHDIVQMAQDSHAEPLSDDTIRRAKRNAKRALIVYFKAFGTEITSQYSSEAKSFPVFQKSISTITDECSRQVGDRLGNLIFDSIGEVLASPSEEQIEALHYLVLAHVTNAIMVLDPNLKEFQATKFSQKTFILDTDFLINCLVPDVDEYALAIQLVKDLIALNATVVIPDSSIDECVLHAKYSVRTYNFFNSSLLSLPEPVASEKIYNAFVRGYYFSIKRGKILSSVNYQTYLYNYYDPDRPEAFMKEVIKTHLPEGIHFKNVADIYSGYISDEEYESVFSEVLKLTAGSKKGRYRDEEENKAYAEVDTSLFLTTLHCNKDAVKDTILGGSHYLITDSGRYRIISSILDYKDSVSTRPQSLMSILTSIGISSISKVDLIKTLENPILMHSMEQHWDDIGKLIKLGFDLSNMTLPRLRVTMEDKLHEHLTKIDMKTASSDSAEFKELLAVAEEAGVPLYLAGQAMEAKLKAKEKTIKELKNDLAAKNSLEQEIEKFGKRRQKYLRRYAKNLKK